MRIHIRPHRVDGHRVKSHRVRGYMRRIPGSSKMVRIDGHIRDGHHRHGHHRMGHTRHY